MDDVGGAVDIMTQSSAQVQIAQLAAWLIGESISGGVLWRFFEGVEKRLGDFWRGSREFLRGLWAS